MHKKWKNTKTKQIKYMIHKNKVTISINDYQFAEIIKSPSSVGTTKPVAYHRLAGRYGHLIWFADKFVQINLLLLYFVLRSRIMLIGGEN